MDTKKFPIEVGQEVFLCPTGNYTRMGMKPRLGVITKIARKYFYVDIQSVWGEAKFEIETFQNVNDDCNSSWVLYPNEESYLEEKRRQEKTPGHPGIFPELGPGGPQRDRQRRVRADQGGGGDGCGLRSMTILASTPAFS